MEETTRAWKKCLEENQRRDDPCAEKFVTVIESLGFSANRAREKCLMIA